MDFPVIGMKETVEIMESGQARAVNDPDSLEAAVDMIKRYQADISNLKEYKKKKVAVISERIGDIEAKVDFLRDVIIQTLKQHNRKTSKFPGLGKVSLRTNKGSWVINDESTLIKKLKAEGEFDKCVVLEEKIKKAEVNKLLDVWKEVDKLPKGVHKEDDEDTVAVTIEKETSDPDAVPVALAAAAG